MTNRPVKKISIDKNKIILRSIGPTIVLLFIYYFIDFDQLLNIFLQLEAEYLLLAVVCVPIVVIIRSLRWFYILQSNQISYPIFTCFKICFVENVAMVVVSTIGTFIKVSYLKRDGYGLLRPVLTIIEEKYFDYLFPLLIGMTSAVLIGIAIEPEISLLVLFATTWLLFFPLRKSIDILKSRFLPGRLNKLILEKGWDLSKYLADIKKNLDFRNYILTIAGFIFYYFSIYFLCLGLSIDLRFSEVVLIVTVTTVISLIPISFFGIGSRDIGLLAAFNLFNQPAEEAIALSMALLLLRVITIGLGAVFWYTDPPPFIELKSVD